MQAPRRSRSTVRYAVLGVVLAAAIGGLLLWNQLQHLAPGGPLRYQALPSEVTEATLQDVRTGESFRLADFRGQVVVLEFITVWCINCVAQGDELAAILPRIGDDVVVVSVDVDPNEDAALLARYVQAFERQWRFAYDETGLFHAEFITRGVRQEIPETPIYIISPDGEGIFKMRPGLKSGDEILQLLQQARS